MPALHSGHENYKTDDIARPASLDAPENRDRRRRLRRGNGAGGGAFRRHRYFGEQRTAYHLERNEWSIHFNSTRDLELFAGDGGDVGQVAKAPDGEWTQLFRPQRS